MAGGAPPVLPSWAYPPADGPDGPRTDRRTTVVLAAVLAALLVVGAIIGVVWWRGSATPTAAEPAPSPSAAVASTAAPSPSSSAVPVTSPVRSSSIAAAPPATVTVVTTTAVPGPQAPPPATVTVTEAPPAPPAPAVPTPTAVPPSRAQPVPPPATGRAAGDLGLPTPITAVSCTGTPIVIYASAVIPDRYAADVQAALDAHPGASYLRTDQACSSLTRSVDGNAIYAVFRAYPSTTAACAAEGTGASVRLLDQGSPDTSTVDC